MTSAQLAALLVDPRSATLWRLAGVTPAQLSVITTALAALYPRQVAKQVNLAQTATLDPVVTWLTTATADYRISLWVAITAVNTDSLTLSISWVDQNGAAQTQNLARNLSASPTLLAVADFIPTVATIRALTGTTIKATATVAGGVTITYDVGGSIEQLTAA